MGGRIQFSPHDCSFQSGTLGRKKESWICHLQAVEPQVANEEDIFVKYLLRTKNLLKMVLSIFSNLINLFIP